MKPIYDIPKASTTLFAAYYPHYKEKYGITKFAHNPSLSWLLPKLLSLFDILSNYIVNFATYRLYYKEEFEMINATYNLYSAIVLKN